MVSQALFPGFSRRIELGTLPAWRWNHWIGRGAPSVLIRSLQVSVIDVIVVDCILAEERLVRQAVNTNVFCARDGVGVRGQGSERGWECKPVEAEIDFRVELKSGVGPGVQPQATHCGVGGKIAVHKNCGANNLRGKDLEHWAGKPDDVR